MKDLKINLKQKNVDDDDDDDIVNIQFAGGEININRSDEDVEITKDQRKIDVESLIKTPYLNVDLILDSTEQRGKVKTNIDHLIQNLHSDIDKNAIKKSK